MLNLKKKQKTNPQTLHILNNVLHKQMYWDFKQLSYHFVKTNRLIMCYNVCWIMHVPFPHRKLAKDSSNLSGNVWITNGSIPHLQVYLDLLWRRNVYCHFTFPQLDSFGEFSAQIQCNLSFLYKKWKWPVLPTFIPYKLSNIRNLAKKCQVQSYSLSE